MVSLPKLLAGTSARTYASAMSRAVGVVDAVLVSANVAGVDTPAVVAATWYEPVVLVAVKVGAVAMPFAPVVASAVAPVPANVPLAPLVGAANVTLTPLTGLPPASVASAASATGNAVPVAADWPLPAATTSAVGGLVGVNSSTSCAGLAPSLLEYCLRLVEAAFISKLNVPLPVTTDVTSTLVQVLAEKFLALPIVGPTAGRLL